MSAFCFLLCIQKHICMHILSWVCVYKHAHNPHRHINLLTQMTWHAGSPVAKSVRQSPRSCLACSAQPNRLLFPSSQPRLWQRKSTWASLYRHFLSTNLIKFMVEWSISLYRHHLLVARLRNKAVFVAEYLFAELRQESTCCYLHATYSAKCLVGLCKQVREYLHVIVRKSP